MNKQLENVEELSALKEQVKCQLPIRGRLFQLSVFTNKFDQKEHLLLTLGKPEGKDSVLTRIHSECLTGDLLGSQKCDCGDQLHSSLDQIIQAGCGILIYLRQEGRGIGLVEKLKAYKLQEQGLDTVDANLALGHAADLRGYEYAFEMLKHLGIRSIRLLTNNPDKIDGLKKMGIEVIERIPLKTTPSLANEEYLNTKRSKMNHLF
ncbi:MAG: GTP cyclohydrolase II [Oligoflexales bacterium]|nr:GTP cyclohydrolase II [Oligoflexales bacterium]